MEVWSDRGSMCKFRNARSVFRNLHVDPLSLHTSMRNKQVEFNPYIYTLTTLSKLYRFGYEISVFNTKHPVIILRASLFVITPSRVASWKIECQNFSYVYRSRKHWECKYNTIDLRPKNPILLFSQGMAHPAVAILHPFKRKRKRSDSVLSQKPLHPQKNPKSNVTFAGDKKYLSWSSKCTLVYMEHVCHLAYISKDASTPTRVPSQNYFYQITNKLVLNL